MKLPVLRERLRTFAQHRVGSLGAVDGEGDEEDGDGVAKSGGDNNSDEAFFFEWVPNILSCVLHIFGSLIMTSTFSSVKHYLCLGVFI